jgi:hypothetical protein
MQFVDNIISPVSLRVIGDHESRCLRGLKWTFRQIQTDTNQYEDRAQFWAQQGTKWGTNF